MATPTLAQFLRATEGHRAFGQFRVEGAGDLPAEYTVYEDALDDADARSRRTFQAVFVREKVDGRWVHNTTWTQGVCVEDEPELARWLLAVGPIGVS